MTTIHVFEGGCYCDDTAPECHSEATVERKEADNPECCGKLVIYYNYYYFYTESPQEKSGTCSRTNPIAGGQFVPVSSVSTLPGQLHVFLSVCLSVCVLLVDRFRSNLNYNSRNIKFSSSSFVSVSVSLSL